MASMIEKPDGKEAEDERTGLSPVPGILVKHKKNSDCGCNQ